MGAEGFFFPLLPLHFWGIQIECNFFAHFGLEYTVAELQWLLNSNSQEKTDIICHRGWGERTLLHFIHGRRSSGNSNPSD